jgi:hypothetical protein
MEGSPEAALLQVLLVQVLLVSGTLASRRHAAAADMKGRLGTAPSAALLFALPNSLFGLCPVIAQANKGYVRSSREEIDHVQPI